MATFPEKSSVPIPPGKVGYDSLRDCHKRAYAYITEALRIDESGTGDKSAAIDYYSKGVSELEKGIAYKIHAQDDGELAKAESIKNKMMRNLEMAKERVTNLLDGGKLIGNNPTNDGGKGDDLASDCSPTDSLLVMAKSKPLPKKMCAAAPVKAPVRWQSNRPSNKFTLGTVRGAGGRGDRPPGGKGKDASAVISGMRGLDSKLAQAILDELVEHGASVTWDDIVGLELPKRILQEIVILPALRPELFTGLRSPARGLLLFGPPGNGKTMLAKAVATESQAKFFNITASSLTSKWVGEGEKLVKTLFTLARELQPSVIFIDEVDALLSRRGDSEHDAMRRLKNEFLVSFDGLSSSEGDRMLVMAATNRPHELDDAALRRFEKRIYIPLPCIEARKSVITKLLSKHKNTISDQQLMQLARSCDGYSGSDLTALAKDAALGPIRGLDYGTLCSISADKVRPINMQDLETSMQHIRPSVSPSLIGTLEDWNSQYGVSS